jgi:hypothetical protein
MPYAGLRVSGWGMVVALLLAIAAPAPVNGASLAAGEYTTERGWGTLEVSPPSGGKAPFTIAAVGSNGHTCELQGDIENARASLEADAGERCIVEFAAVSGGVDVTSNEACRYYCGARASFDGRYLQPPAGCTGGEQVTTRASFKRLYDQKMYAEARATLEPLLARCGRILSVVDQGWVRNDLALTQHKLGDDRGCRQTLAPLAADAARSDAVIAADLPPADADTYLRIVKATRTNARLCGAGKKP